MNNKFFRTLEKNLNLVAQLQKQNQAAIAELTENTKKTDIQLAKTDAQLAKTDAQLAKTDVKLAKIGAKIDKVSDMYGGLSNNIGATTEEFFVNALHKKPVINGMQFDIIYKQLNGKTKNIQDEFDIVLLNGVSVFIIEVKNKAHKNDIDRLIDKKSQNFAVLFPHYSHYKTYLGLATFCIDDELKSYAI